jgi:hypothetical protein
MLSSGLGGSYVPTASAALGEALLEDIPDVQYFGEVSEPFAPPKPREPDELPPPMHVYNARQKLNEKRRAKSERQHWIGVSCPHTKINVLSFFYNICSF